MKLKEIDKDKLYKFLREMEFNRLLSSAISAYGEPDLTGTRINDKNEKIDQKNQKQLIIKIYQLITKMNK